ncbi:hypothetical protein KFE25_001220 [Diacronema lutheri]|uniref:PCI domain-containing protein n=2 Tax=Diacronema lutheri TaxID=2081491 RepID=A0A8J6C856_DIALT|nr:hypothetical protein KFE25_001220 [Diacronema lutheri]
MDVFDEGGAPELQQFVLLAQSARGAACAALIRQVLAHPKVFVFGELLAVRNVRELAGTEHTPALALLNTFAYGTWSDLAPAMAATLDLPMALKLKKLTVVSMCASEEVIAYDVLQKAAAIDSVRELEDLLISLIYEGLLRGKLDQRSKHIKVAHAIARDVHPDELPRLAAKLQAWRDTNTGLMAALEGQARAYKDEQSEQAARKAALQQRVAQQMEKLRHSAPHMDMGGSSVGAQDGYDLDEDLPMVLHGEGRRLGGRVLKGKHPPGGSGRRAHEDFR